MSGLKVHLVMWVIWVIMTTVKYPHVPGKFRVEGIDSVAMKVGKVYAARPGAHGSEGTEQESQEFPTLF